MQMKTVLIGALSLVFGLSAAVGVYLLGRSAPAAPKAAAVSVVVVTVDIKRGQTLTAAELTKRDWPKEMVPDGAIFNIEDVLDRTVAIPLIKGEVLLEVKLAAKGAGRGMAAIIPAGMRAVTIQTPNVATGVAGFVLPGNKVDILLTMTNQGAADQTGGGSTITLLQNVEILAVDQRTDVPEDNKMDSRELRSVTLLVSPDQASRLDLGQNKGTLRLTLRNPNDKVTDYVDPITLTELSLNPSEIFRGPKDVSVVQAEPHPFVRPKIIDPQIRTLRGLQLGRVPFPARNDESIDSTDATVPPLVRSNQ